MNLNLVLRRSRSLERWLHGLTVLLEKEFGNINIDKLWAIYLCKADLNWVLQVNFEQKCDGQRTPGIISWYRLSFLQLQDQVIPTPQ